MKRTPTISVSQPSGFTLAEVLIALAIAAVGFGVVLHGVGLQMTLVATSIERHQMLMYASEVVETTMSSGSLGNEEVEEPIDRFTRTNSEYDQEGLAAVQFFYNVSTQPVTSDPRVQQVTVQVRGDHGQIRLSAYRLRVKRADGDNDSEGDSQP